MKKIAMLTCLNANRVCTGAACFKAFNERRKSFERYKDQDVEVAAFMRCNGCDSDPATDKGILEKVERLKQEGVTAVHVGVCTKKQEFVRCEKITAIMRMIVDAGIELVDGTH